MMFEWVEDMILGGSNEGANAKQFDTDPTYFIQNIRTTD